MYMNILPHTAVCVHTAACTYYHTLSVRVRPLTNLPHGSLILILDSFLMGLNLRQTEIERETERDRDRERERERGGVYKGTLSQW